MKVGLKRLLIVVESSDKRHNLDGVISLADKEGSRVEDKDIVSYVYGEGRERVCLNLDMIPKELEKVDVVISFYSEMRPNKVSITVSDGRTEVKLANIVLKDRRLVNGVKTCFGELCRDNSGMFWRFYKNKPDI